MTTRRPPLPDLPPPAPDLEYLRRLVARLRAADGCAWDRQQTLASVRSYLIEEAHEAAAALDEGDAVALREELGDVLFQCAFVGRLAEEAGDFTLAEAIDGVADKMIARHPHVFARDLGSDAATLDDVAAVERQWEQRKLADRRERLDHEASPLAGVPASLPALVGAYRLGQKASGVGFDWPDAPSVLAKVSEELHEVTAELDAADGEPSPALEEELGDLLFAVAQLSRRLRIDPDRALARANAKFRRRFDAVWRRAREDAKEPDLDRLERLWAEVKREERPPSTARYAAGPSIPPDPDDGDVSS
ncbi:MAG: nucleoside triphosphate pyrophosphohydrolase [Acidobacteriota bacterium]